MSKRGALDLLALVVTEAKRILLPGTSLHKESTGYGVRLMPYLLGQIDHRGLGLLISGGSRLLVLVSLSLALALLTRRFLLHLSFGLLLLFKKIINYYSFSFK